MSNPPSPQPNLQESHLKSARASLKQAIAQYGQLNRHRQIALNPSLQAALKPEVEVLKSSLDKLDQGVIRIAAFGLVSRGKSAVLNALMGEKVLQTGPLNGVTQWPRSVRWTPQNNGKVQVELIDTPGLDEIQGQARAQMARSVARQSDLILFIVAGDITRTEYQALLELEQAQKPLILVFNKTDLYPEQDIEAIYRKLQQLGATEVQSKLLTPNEIVRVAADPIPRQMRLEWPDGRVTYEWETPKPQVDELKHKLLELLNREGRSLLALNAMVQAREASVNIARKTLELRDREAEALIWKFARYKAIAVAANPIAILDLVGGGGGRFGADSGLGEIIRSADD